ncbi:MAG: pilus assembly protein PilM [Bacillota bacterium]|nr:pilus assembly protein PilM [Bacillota bacterium]
MLKNKIACLFIQDNLIAGITYTATNKRLWAIDNFFHINIPEGYIDNGQLIKPVHVAKLLTPLVIRYKLKGVKASIAISSNQVINRIIAIPKMTEAELKEAIFWEIKPFLSQAHSSMSVDYTLLHQFQAEEKGNQVYIAAAPKEIVMDYIELLKKIKLTPWRVGTNWIVLLGLAARPHLITKTNAEYMLFVDLSGNCFLIAKDAISGFTVRHFKLVNEEKLLAEELQYIINQLDKKYSSNSEKIHYIGEPSEILTKQLAALNKQVVILTLPQVIEQLAMTVATAAGGIPQNYPESYLMCLGLMLGELQHEAN